MYINLNNTLESFLQVVENKATGFSKGCAFVQFLIKEDADECLKTINDEKTVSLISDRE